MIWFDDSLEWQLWTSVFVIELNVLLLKPTDTPVKPIRFVNWSKEDFTQLACLPVLINLCHFNTARPQFYAILNLFLVSLPWLEAPPVSFPIAQ